MNDLPPLPPPDRTMHQYGKQIDHFTADQMRAYAQAALDAIDRALGLPDDGCNSTALDAIRLLQMMHRDDLRAIKAIKAERYRLQEQIATDTAEIACLRAALDDAQAEASVAQMAVEALKADLDRERESRKAAQVQLEATQEQRNRAGIDARLAEGARLGGEITALRAQVARLQSRLDDAIAAESVAQAVVDQLRAELAEQIAARDSLAVGGS